MRSKGRPFKKGDWGLRFTKRGRSYMLAMPKTAQNAATRIMQPYTILDRFAAAIPTIPKQARKKRRRRRK